MTTLFLAWQDPQSRRWFPIGRLDFDGSEYQFAYTNGVRVAQEKAEFTPLHSFPDINRVYRSSELFPMFSNRLMRRSRPDYKNYIQWLNIPEGKDDPIAILARSGGSKVTDTFELFPYPEPDENGFYRIHFFMHGIRYMPECSIHKIEQLQNNDRLYLTHDIQNQYDSKALLLLTIDRHSIGYCPRFISEEIFDILQQEPQSIEVRIEKINPLTTPLQFRLLCNLNIKFQQNAHLFSSQNYQPICLSKDVLLT
jgi:hypothetical protein